MGEFGLQIAIWGLLYFNLMHIYIKEEAADAPVQSGGGCA